jgi:hypothetical protein
MRWATCYAMASLYPNEDARREPGRLWYQAFRLANLYDVITAFR